MNSSNPFLNNISSISFDEGFDEDNYFIDTFAWVIVNRCPQHYEEFKSIFPHCEVNPDGWTPLDDPRSTTELLTLILSTKGGEWGNMDEITACMKLTAWALKHELLQWRI
jgi:hypothetical protein